MALGALLMASLGLAWVGGNWWYSGAGCILGVAGHWTSWHWRSHQSRVRPLFIGASVIGTSIWMRTETVAALNGDWVPVGHFLILVLGISSFDLRTRGGLYTSLALGGTVMFFASQQAFGPGFGIFFIGFLVALLGFLALSFLEDAIRGAQVFWRKRALSVSFFWVGSICALFLFSSLAFWVMPKEAIKFAGPPQVSVLPYSTSSLDASSVPEFDLDELLSEPVPPVESPLTRSLTQPAAPIPHGSDPFGDLTEPVPGEDSANPEPSAAGDSLANPTSDTQPDDGDHPSRPEADRGAPDQTTPGLGAALPDGQAASPEDVALYVRSKVSSYWRGQTRLRFDGRRWLQNGTAGPLVTPLVPIEGLTGQWHNRESADLDNSIRYHQTFFIRLDHPNSVFMGYGGLKIVDGVDGFAGSGVTEGDSYQVVSAQPRDDTQRLNLDHTVLIDPGYILLPKELENDLRKIAGRLGRGTVTDFQRLEQIVGFVAKNNRYDEDQQVQPDMSVDLRGFLFDRQPGGSLEFATSVTLLARASGLPARLALGYLPGMRDPLSGAYMVRVKDAHAWSEIYFAGHGWVPFDSTPRAAAAASSDSSPGLNRLFSSGVNAGVPGAVKNVTQHVSLNIPDGLLDGLRNPWSAVLAAAFAVAVLAFRVLYPRWKQGQPLESGPALAYASPASPGVERS